MRFGSTLLAAAIILLFTPGSIFRMLCMLPSFSICFIALRKSWRSMPSLRIFFSMRFASSASNVCCAFSTSVRTSPCWRMRPAMRSGWNVSKSSTFSPVEANRNPNFGAPTKALDARQVQLGLRLMF